MASTFPTTIDIIPLFKDITQEDATLLSQFQEAIKVGNFTLASTYLNQITDANQKIVSAQRLNKLRDCILEIEDFYKNDIQPYINTKQSKWKSRINQFDYKGIYNSTVTYKKNNMVLYSINGLNQLYIYINNTQSSNKEPANTTYWRVLTIQGQRGESSTVTSSVFAFNWESAQLYSINTIVYYNNCWWISKVENQNQTPQENSDYWDLVLKVEQPIYPIQSYKPTNQSIGELWFKI